MLRRHDIVCWACCFAIIAGGGGLARARRPVKSRRRPRGVPRRCLRVRGTRPARQSPACLNCEFAQATVI